MYHKVSNATGASSRYLYFGSIGTPSGRESIDRCSWVKVTPKVAGSTAPRTVQTKSRKVNIHYSPNDLYRTFLIKMQCKELNISWTLFVNWNRHLCCSLKFKSILWKNYEARRLLFNDVEMEFQHHKNVVNLPPFLVFWRKIAILHRFFPQETTEWIKVWTNSISIPHINLSSTHDVW